MSTPAPGPDWQRRCIRVRGLVQGVGFRPFVHRLACGLGLVGHVGNDGEGVFVEVEGPGSTLVDFERRLVAEAPPLASIHALESEPAQCPGGPSGLGWGPGGQGFRIVESPPGGATTTFVSPDVAVCGECLAELFDPADRRYRYPFITCTNCGPRFSITVGLPYDRPRTTMAGFALCPACAGEYHDPTDRRFHAQPVACWSCGPSLWFSGPGGDITESDPALGAAQEALAAGAVVAVKGLGGFHLACDATSSEAVGLLRRRKHRPEKPLAVMVADVATAGRLAVVGRAEASVLGGRQAPIVLLERRGRAPLSPLVAPGNPTVGVMLAYTPLHHLLLRPVPGGPAPPPVLVMTSGNLSDEPICHEDHDARGRLGPLVDAWLTHDRPIHVPCDDSVVRLEGGRQLPIRRSRGYAPLPITLPFDSGPELAVGGELKNAFCLASGRQAWMSQHLGDMGSVETLAAFERSSGQFAGMYRVRPGLTAADAHPGYSTRRWAEASGPHDVELVQHHHAHIASVMVEHGIPLGQRVVGVAFDGTGYGTDGAVWGGEILVAGYDDFERRCHLRYVPLPGGEAAIAKPYRAALAHLWAAGIDWAADLAPVRAASAVELRAIQRQLERGTACVATSSMGRLFDAVSSLLGLRHRVSFEAQGAIELESEAAGWPGPAPAYRFGVSGGQFDAGPVLAALVGDLRRGCPPAAVAAGFHRALAEATADICARVAADAGIGVVALSGGVFQNVVLLTGLRDRLAGRGLRVLTHGLVPPNDGGLALGQAAVAAARHRARGPLVALASGTAGPTPVVPGRPRSSSKPHREDP